MGDKIERKTERKKERKKEKKSRRRKRGSDKGKGRNAKSKTRRRRTTWASSGTRSKTDKSWRSPYPKSACGRPAAARSERVRLSVMVLLPYSFLTCSSFFPSFQKYYKSHSNSWASDRCFFFFFPGYIMNGFYFKKMDVGNFATFQCTLTLKGLMYVCFASV